MSTSKSWKAEERIFAAALGGRRNPNNGRRQADINAGPFAIEHKKTRIMPALLRRAWEQAHAGAAVGEIPVVAMSHAHGGGVPTSRYVMLRLDDFAAIWRVIEMLDGSRLELLSAELAK